MPPLNNPPYFQNSEIEPIELKRSTTLYASTNPCQLDENVYLNIMTPSAPPQLGWLHPQQLPTPQNHLEVSGCMGSIFIHSTLHISYNNRPFMYARLCLFNVHVCGMCSNHVFQISCWITTYGDHVCLNIY